MKQFGQLDPVYNSARYDILAGWEESWEIRYYISLHRQIANCLPQAVFTSGATYHIRRMECHVTPWEEPLFRTGVICVCEV